jgi:flavin-dependent dehydrogenase
LRIAIVGAGLAGLACAHELERLGFTAQLFEKEAQVGKRATVVETMAQFMHLHPRQDILAHLQQDLHLPFQPANHIHQAVLHGPHHKAQITGHIGYTTVRGADERSPENQLARHVRSPITYGRAPDVYALAREYDWVVVATGDPTWAKEFLQWQTDIVWSIRGAVVTGEFNPSRLDFFFRSAYADAGYAMVSPIDERRATVGVAVPNITAGELDRFWQAFRMGERRRWTAEEEQFQFERLEYGTVRACVLGNVLLVGAGAGFAEGLSLSGQCMALTSGVCAARQILLQDRSLERLHRRWKVRYQQIHNLRRVVDGWGDPEMDLFVRSVSLGGKLAAFAPWNLVAPAGMVADLFLPPEP